MGTMTAPVGPAFLSVPLDVLVNRDLDKNGRDLLETLHKTSAATSTTASADMLLEPASKKQKLQSEPPVDSAEAALLRAGRKKPPWTPTEQAVVAIKHCELGNRLGWNKKCSRRSRRAQVHDGLPLHAADGLKLQPIFP